MATAGDIADWWDEQHRLSKRELDHFVEDNPNLFGVLVATTAATAMELGAGLVDTLRLGQGAAEGGLKGYGKDALRLLQLAGPLGKATKLASPLAKAAQPAVTRLLARLVVDRGGPVCGWVSAAQALRQTGTRMFASIDDLARAQGIAVEALMGSRLAARIPVLRQLGADVDNLITLSTNEAQALKQIAQLTPREGVLLIRLAGKRLAGSITSNVHRTQDVAHAIYAFRDSLGRLKFLDRSGKLYDSLDDLARAYRVFTGWIPEEVAVMRNVVPKYILGAIGQASSEVGAWVLGISVALAPAATVEENEAVAQAFIVRKAMAANGPAAVAGPSPRHHVVKPGDWLSKIAKTYYNDMHRWPPIYEANRAAIGRDPNLIKPGQNLLIPVLPKIEFGKQAN